MADNELKYATYEQIATLLSYLATNYTNIANVFYDVFYNENPQDITIQLYDESGVLQSYTFPNRAKDMKYVLDGEGDPEGEVIAPKGSIYLDTLNGKAYIKQVGTDSNGWIFINPKNNTLEGYGSPNGQVVAEKGTLYTDKQNATLYIKGTSYGNSGWISFVSTELDVTPTQGSTKGVTSGGVYTAIEEVRSEIGNIEEALRRI